MYQNLPRIKAQRRIFDGFIDDTDLGERTYALYAVATGDLELAEKMKTAHMEATVERKCREAARSKS